MALESIAPLFEPGARCAMIFADGGEGYLRTAYDDAWVDRELGVSAGRAGDPRGNLEPSAAARLERRPAAATRSDRRLRAQGPLCARALGRPCSATLHAGLSVDVYEPHPCPGAGPVYDPAQPPYLRMNFAADMVDMWPARDLDPERPSFSEWRSGIDGESDEAYPSRALVGRYLAHGFRRVTADAPERCPSGTSPRPRPR